MKSLPLSPDAPQNLRDYAGRVQGSLDKLEKDRRPLEVISDITLEKGRTYGVNTSSARSLTMPVSGARRDFIEVADETGQAATNNITVTRSGSDTLAGATTFVIDVNYGSVRFVEIEGGWRVSF